MAPRFYCFHALSQPRQFSKFEGMNMTVATHPHTTTDTTSQPTLLTLSQLCQAEPAITPGGVRHLLFTKGHDLPGVYRFGRKLLFDRLEFMGGIKQGHAAQISGRTAQ
jgi:hypothetical protein